MELQHETVLKAGPIEPEELVSEVSFPDPVFQWVECVSESYYNENGNLISTKHTTYFQPPKQIYEIPEMMNIICPDLTVIMPEPVQEEASTFAESPDSCKDDAPTCEEEESSDTEEATEGEDDFVYRITPKGCFTLSLVHAGICEDVDDPYIDVAWEEFERSMTINGYVHSDGEDLEFPQ